MSQYSDGDDEASDSLSSDNTGENLLIPKKPAETQSYFFEQFSGTGELPKGRTNSGVAVGASAEVSANPNTSGVSLRNSMSEDKRVPSRTSKISTDDDVRHSQWSKTTGASNESNQQDPCSPNSSRTVSTFILLKASEDISIDKLRLEPTDEVKTSSYYPQPISKTVAAATLQQEEPFEFEKTDKFKFEKAVRHLQQEAKDYDIHTSSSNPISQENDFRPHEYKIIQKSSEASLKIDTDPAQVMSPKKSDITTHSPSLLNKILVPSPKNEKRIEIPALRSVSGSVYASPKVANVETFKQTVPVAPERARLTKITRISDSQIDLAVDILQGYKNDIHGEISNSVDLEANGGSIANEFSRAAKISSTNSSRGAMPIQHVSTTSLHSFDSQKIKFHEIYSIPRIVGLLICCFIIPTLFFMISIGKKGGISDFRLMRMIMNRKHRIGMLKGFAWDIDIGWFRSICLILGIIEVLGILACIGSGIGVGLRRQSR